VGSARAETIARRAREFLALGLFLEIESGMNWMREPEVDAVRKDEAQQEGSRTLEGDHDF